MKNQFPHNQILGSKILTCQNPQRSGGLNGPFQEEQLHPEQPIQYFKTVSIYYSYKYITNILGLVA